MHRPRMTGAVRALLLLCTLFLLLLCCCTAAAAHRTEGLREHFGDAITVRHSPFPSKSHQDAARAAAASQEAIRAAAAKERSEEEFPFVRLLHTLTDSLRECIDYVSRYGAPKPADPAVQAAAAERMAALTAAEVAAARISPRGSARRRGDSEASSLLLLFLLAGFFLSCCCCGCAAPSVPSDPDVLFVVEVC